MSAPSSPGLHFPSPPSHIARTAPPPLHFSGVAPSPTLSPEPSLQYSPSSSFALHTRTLPTELPSDGFSLSSPCYDDKVGGTLATFSLDSTPASPPPPPSTLPSCCECTCAGWSCGCAGRDCSGDRLLVVVAVLALLLLVAVILLALGLTGHLSSTASSSQPWTALPPGLSSSGGAAPVFPPACVDCRSPSAAVSSYFAPFVAPPANATDFCLDLADATSCLVSLLTTWQGHTITVPHPNVQYPVRLGSSYGQNPLVLLSGTVFDGNNCSFVNTATPAGQPGAYYLYSNFMWYLQSNTALVNVSLVSSIPSYGVNLETGASNVLLSSVSILGLGVLDEEGTFQGGSAVVWGGNNSNTEVAHCYFTQVGYGLVIDAPYVTNLSIHHNLFVHTRADAISVVASVLSNPYDRSTFTTDFAPTHVSIFNNSLRDIGAANSSQPQWGYCMQSSGAQDVLIQDNDLSGCSWQGVLIGDAGVGIRVLNNRIDRVYGNDSVGWAGQMDGVHVGRAADVTIAGNAFTNIRDSAIGLLTSCNALTIPGPGASLVAVPALHQTANHVSVVNNSFGGWGQSGRESSAAVRGGGYPSQPGLQQLLWGNSYAAVTAGLGSPLTWCLCPGSMEVADAAPWGQSNSSQGCDGSDLSADMCSQPYDVLCPALPTSSSSSTSSPRPGSTASAPAAVSGAQTSAAASATSPPVPTSAPSAAPTSAPAPTSRTTPSPTSVAGPAPTSTPVPSPTSAAAPAPTSAAAQSPTAPAGGGGGGGGGDGAPTCTPNTNVDYCLDYGTGDSSACLYTLLSTPGCLRVPVPNFVYYVQLHQGPRQAPLVVGPGTVFDGNNCTFYGNAPSPYYYDSQVGWYMSPAGNGGGNYGQGDC